MTKTVFTHELGAKVALALSGEKGVVVARLESAESSPQYRVRFVAADGRQCEDWFTDPAIVKDASAPKKETKASKSAFAVSADEVAASADKGKKKKAVVEDEDDEDEEGDKPKKSKSAPAKAGKKSKVVEEDDEDESETEDDAEEDEETEADDEESEGDEEDDAEADDEEETEDDEEDEVPSVEEVTKAGIAYGKAKGKPALIKVLKAHGAEKLDQVKKSKRAAFLKAVKLKKAKAEDEDEE